MATKKNKPYNKILNDDFGKKIRDARTAANLSQAELAELVGVSDRAISAYEQNRNRPSVAKLQKIADETNYSLRFFVGDPDPIITVQKKLADIEQDLQEIKKLLAKRTKSEN